MPSYEIALLGRFMVRVKGQPVITGAWRYKRAAELVKILALADTSRWHSDHAMDLLWPDLAPHVRPRAPAQGVHLARAFLGAASVLSRSHGMLELCPDGQVYDVDALAFEAAARARPVRRACWTAPA